MKKTALAGKKEFTLLSLFVLLVLTLTNAASSYAQTASSVTAILGVSDGQQLSGTANIQALVSGSNTRFVSFQLTGAQNKSHNEFAAPYYFFGDVQTSTGPQPRGWDTTRFPNGDYELTVTAVSSAGQGSGQRVRFSLVNSVVSTNNFFQDTFDRTSLGSYWRTRSGQWSATGASLASPKNGYSEIVTSQPIGQSKYVVEYTASGFGATQGPSPADSIRFTFGQDRIQTVNVNGINYELRNHYELVYLLSSFGNYPNFSLRRVYTLNPNTSPEFTSVVLAAGTLPPPSSTNRFRIVRDAVSGLIQVFVDQGQGFPATPNLQALDTNYATLGYFGWLIDTQGPGGTFYVHDVKAQWELNQQ